MDLPGQQAAGCSIDTLLQSSREGDLHHAYAAEKSV